MANLGRFTIQATGDWVNVTTLANITNNCVIQPITNTCVVCEKATKPSADEGFIVPEGKAFQFNPGDTLWCKPFNAQNYVLLNISQKG